jgi:hypothetical protein
VTNPEGQTEPTGADVHLDGGADGQVSQDDFDATPTR